MHDVRNFDFNLIQYLTDIGEKKRNEILKSCLKMAKPEHRNTCPQELLLIGTMSILMALMVHDRQCEGRKLSNRFHQLKADRLDAETQSTPKE